MFSFQGGGSNYLSGSNFGPSTFLTLDLRIADFSFDTASDTHVFSIGSGFYIRVSDSVTLNFLSPSDMLITFGGDAVQFGDDLIGFGGGPNLTEELEFMSSAQVSGASTGGKISGDLVRFLVTVSGQDLNLQAELDGTTYNQSYTLANDFIFPAGDVSFCSGPNNLTSLIGDTEIYIDGGILNRYVMPSSGVLVIDQVNSNDLTVINPTGSDFINTSESIPTLTISPVTTVANAPIDIRITPSEPVFGLQPEDFLVSAGSISNVREDGADWLATYTPPIGEGSATVQLPSGVVANATGTLNLESNEITISYDRLAPVVNLTGPSDPQAGIFDIALTANEDIATPLISAFTTVDCEVVSVAGSGSSYSVSVAPTNNGSGNASITLNAGGASDIYGNATTIASNTVVVDYYTLSITTKITVKSSFTSYELKANGANISLHYVTVQSIDTHAIKFKKV